LQIKGIVVEAEDKCWNIYFKRFPYVKNDEVLSKALTKVVLYEFQISWARLIDNGKGFGNRTETRY